jgi:hypothetical protein
VEVIDHQRRVGQDVADRGGVAPEGVDRGDLDAVHPHLGLLTDPAADHLAGTARHDVEQPGPVDVDERGRHLGAPAGVACKKVCSSTPSLATSASRSSAAISVSP